MLNADSVQVLGVVKQTFANITFILLWLVRSTYCLLYEYEYDDPDLQDDPDLYDELDLYDDPDLYDELDLNDEPERLATHESRHNFFFLQ